MPSQYIAADTRNWLGMGPVHDPMAAAIGRVYIDAADAIVGGMWATSGYDEYTLPFMFIRSCSSPCLREMLEDVCERIKTGYWRGGVSWVVLVGTSKIDVCTY